jgi:hypothetical protein
MRTKESITKSELSKTNLASLGSMQISLRKPDFTSGTISAKSLSKTIFSKPSTSIDQPVSLTAKQKVTGFARVDPRATSAFRFQEPTKEAVPFGKEVGDRRLPPEKKMSYRVQPSIKLINAMNRSKSGIVGVDIPLQNLDGHSSTDHDQYNDSKLGTVTGPRNPMTQYLLNQIQPYFGTDNSTIHDSTIQRLKIDLSEIFPKQMIGQPNSTATISLSGLKTERTRPNFEPISIDFVTSQREGRRNTNISQKRDFHIIASPRNSKVEDNIPPLQEIRLQAVNRGPVKKVVFRLDKKETINPLAHTYTHRP